MRAKANLGQQARVEGSQKMDKTSAGWKVLNRAWVEFLWVVQLPWPEKHDSPVLGQWGWGEVLCSRWLRGQACLGSELPGGMKGPVRLEWSLLLLHFCIPGIQHVGGPKEYQEYLGHQLGVTNLGRADDSRQESNGGVRIYQRSHWWVPRAGATGQGGLAGGRMKA
jgi:hypothetical protein